MANNPIRKYCGKCQIPLDTRSQGGELRCLPWIQGLVRAPLHGQQLLARFSPLCQGLAHLPEIFTRLLDSIH